MSAQQAVGIVNPAVSGMLTAVVFPGQGVQAERMGEVWRDAPEWEVVDEVAQATAIDVEALLLRTPGETLRRTDLAQIAVFATSMIALEQSRRSGEPDTIVAYAGHSVGEYAALVAAGALTLADGARLVTARGRAMLAASARAPGTMAAVMGADTITVVRLTEEVSATGAPVWAANFNSPGQVVVSGTVDGVGSLCELATQRGMRVVALRVGGAFHTPLMASAEAELRRALEATSFAPRHAPVVANVDSRPYAGDCDWRDLLLRQLTSPVRWADVVSCLVGPQRCERIAELGTGRTLAGLVRRMAPDVEVVSLNAPQPLPARPAS